jgi:hypothetical protein
LLAVKTNIYQGKIVFIKRLKRKYYEQTRTSIAADDYGRGIGFIWLRGTWPEL